MDSCADKKSWTEFTEIQRRPETASLREESLRRNAAEELCNLFVGVCAIKLFQTVTKLFHARHRRGRHFANMEGAAERANIYFEKQKYMLRKVTGLPTGESASAALTQERRDYR
mmetsp:Transcript_114746/g.256121  ORF Transcript_114746/g.256121 Transcript_114746/m.256121 type:complete len:114 (+) Transcript_114746:192-533(+)|eukprot:CAMPEP_0180504420 /NCGR_PEP_ID=MMETSP1036_2-20121128/46712_1 /TAXON_ID=632150 /ORGANISM="Azadinium spinosum, Strain 3D9" /LENGTH=113 /DNA_ID=CAMNT_0022513825 /DNA_START=45 /DNA_END=386 /DNA_ORIENTATION=+